MTKSPSPRWDCEVEVLVLEPDPEAAEEISAALFSRVHLNFVSTVSEAEMFLHSKKPRLLLCADNLPGETGLMFLARTEKLWPGTRRVLMAPDLDGDLFFIAMREVAIFSYLNKPLNRGELIRTVHHAVSEQNQSSNNDAHQARPDSAELPGWVRILLVASAAGVATLIVIVVLAGLYEAKSFAGIDIFPNWHMADLFQR